MGLGAERHAKAVSLSLSALLGLGLALTVYPLSFLLGDAARFHSHTLAPNDAIEYTLAWRALADYGAPWPSVRSDIFNHPEGASTTLMDGLPLAATLARPFKGLLPDGFHYFGVWTALAIVLQGVAGVALLRAAGVRSIAPALCAATLALTMPIFVGRLNQSHVALSTQGLLILAIALGVLATRERIALGRVFGAAAPLALASVAVHPLLGLQVLLFALLALMLAAARWPARLGAAAALCVAFVALCAWLGVFDVESLGNQVALGAFGFSPLAMLVGEPDAVREFYNSQGVEQETWLGWGCVLALAGAAIARPRGRLANTALAWMILVLALAAVSPWWRHGTSYYDWSFLLPDFVRDLYAVHRATARLAWPAVIVFTILPLAHVVRTWPRRRAMLLLGVALPLQLWAAYPYWRAEHAQARFVLHAARAPAGADGGRDPTARLPGNPALGARSLASAAGHALGLGVRRATGERRVRAPATNGSSGAATRLAHAGARRSLLGGRARYRPAAQTPASGAGGARVRALGNAGGVQGPWRRCQRLWRRHTGHWRPDRGRAEHGRTTRAADTFGCESLPLNG